MLKNDYIIKRLHSNLEVFRGLTDQLTPEEYLWKSAPDKWCILEIVCHLHDEEQEDFRARTKMTLEEPTREWPKIDPLAWVAEHKYIKQNFEDVREKFFSERLKSVAWLQSLTSPKWFNAYHHPKVGPVTAEFLLNNWLAHDYLHIRQINKVKYECLSFFTGGKLDYAGEW